MKLLKHCSKCGKEKHILEFYQHPGMLDGHCNSCKECIKQRVRERYRDNVDKGAHILQCKLWRHRNPERVKGYKRKWNKANKKYKKMHQHMRRALMAELPNDLTAEDWREVLELFGHKCAYCDAEAELLEQDHFIPVAMGGGYERGNILPACPSCNRRKSAKSPLAFLGIRKYGEIMTRIHGA